MSELKTLLEEIARSIVDDADSVSVVQQGDDDTNFTLTLSVAQSDMGRVIGRGGRIAHSIRVVMKAAAIAHRVRVNVEIR